MYLEPGKDITLFNAGGTRHIKDSERLYLEIKFYVISLLLGRPMSALSLEQ